MARKTASANEPTSNPITSNGNQSNPNPSSKSNPSNSTVNKAKRARISDQNGSDTTGTAGASTSKSSSNAQGQEKKKQKKETRKKVTLACVYCRRSHMTCDSSRPCQRCIKREIAHLCHDEPNPKTHPHGPVKPKSNDSQVAADSRPNTSTASTSKIPIISTPNQDLSQDFENHDDQSFMSGDQSGYHQQQDDSDLRRSSSSSSTAIAGSPFDRTSNGPYSSSSALGALRTSGSSSSSMQPSIALTSETSPVLAPPYSFNSQGLNNSISASAELAGLRASATGQTPLLSLGSLASSSSFGGSGGNNLNSVVTPSQGGGGGGGMNWFSGNSFNTTPGGSGLGSASWLGLGGTTDRNGGEMTSDAAGGSEFNILSDFLDSLDGASIFGQQPIGGNGNNNQDLGGVSIGIGEDGLGDSNDQGLGASNYATPGNFDQNEGIDSSSLNPNNPETTPSTSNNIIKKQSDSTTSSTIPLPPGFSSKTEKFFLTAADQNDGTRDERLAKVIQAKYDAGLLRPYNPIPGYARLQSWCQSHASNSSRRRIMKPISVFRPAFRQAAQSLSNLDLIFEAEATERLLLDYDRVFSTQGVPACLWRRAGEIYQGNREFAELVGVPVEMLREGKLCIYELMTEESAVNYWEKYGAVSFDAGQKAVLTSCVLRSRNTSYSSRSGFSAANAVAAQLPRSQVPSAIQSGSQTPAVSNQNPTSSSNLNVTKNGSRPGSSKGLSSSSSNGNEESNNNASSSSSSKGKEKETNQNQSEFFKDQIVEENKDGSSKDKEQPSSSSSVFGKEKEKKKHVPRGREREEEEEGVVQIECCFSFTIRRDKVMIPQLIVGNFLPSRLE